jgi:hypothetical protein
LFKKQTGAVIGHSEMPYARHPDLKITYLLLGALIPVLHVEESLTRPGIICGDPVSFFAVVACNLSFCTFAPV